MAVARANGIDIHYRVEGSGPWLTLSHSLACDLSMWEPQMAALTPNFTVLRYDTRGHGRSTVSPGPYTLDLLADDVVALLDALGVARTHFVGLSMGGMIGQCLALRHGSRLERLVLACTSSRMPPESAPLWAERIKLARSQGMAPLVEPTLARWFTEPFRRAQPKAAGRIGNLIATTPEAGYAACAQPIAGLDLSARLGEIGVPTLVIAGAQDAGTPLAMAQAIAAGIAGARLEIIAGAAHLANVEQTDVFNGLLLDFLAPGAGA